MRISRIVRQAKALNNDSIPINIRIAYAGTQFELFSGEYATVKNWDTKRRVFKQGGMAVYMNRQLDNLENLIKEVWYETIQEHPTPDPKELKLAIDKRRFPDKYSTKYIPPLEFIFKFADDHKSQLSESFIRKAKSTSDHLKAYKPNVKWQDLRIDFWNGLTSYLYSKGMSPGGIEAYYKFIKSMCRYALRLEYPISRDFELIKISAVPTQKITLTQIEVNRLLHMPQQENFMENVRGKFLFLIFTGMRFSDLQRMGDGNIVQMGEFRLLRYTQVKTKEVVTIALSDYAEEIIDRWPDLFNPMSEQAFNSKIKEVCKEAGIKELVNVTTYKGGHRVQEQKPKWQTVSSHVGRHTHGVLSIERGLHTRLLQDNFGHGSLSSTQVYTKVNDLERYKATLEAWKRPENEVTK